MRPSLCLPFPIQSGDDRFMAQVVVPRNMSEAEADRLCAFIKTLVVPWNTGSAPVDAD